MVARLIRTLSSNLAVKEFHRHRIDGYRGTMSNDESSKPIPPETSLPSAKNREPGAPKWEQSAKARILSGLKKIGKPTMMLIDKDAAEADTRHLVTDILVDLLGFDKYENLTAEYTNLLVLNQNLKMNIDSFKNKIIFFVIVFFAIIYYFLF